ncbi:YggS family pyridoxal phosphate-dependent enzyme [Cellulomonas endophytica]|uniref:YggS family pyridoxal phosphate-dependent enzyme n=1 Tax=Cellulomonas endophytica TaxID=2494735 RepID=UPI0010133687|nr:YggS family pyridoxal phosphate-dependent enzyme [Cellulomonas endophytica]
MLVARLAAARARVAEAERAAGRPAGSVRLLLATKTVPVERLRAVLDADRAATGGPGAPAPVLLGENRVQELVAKAPALGPGPEWHVIGPLQSNKVNAALRWAACVESVADEDLADRLARRCEATGRTLDVLVQVNVSGEATKHGVAPGDALALARHVAGLAPLRLRGLMTVGARSDDPAVVRAGYARLRALRDAVLGSGLPGTGAAHELSMGMSGDLEAAVLEGATVVRLGTAVFGARPAPGSVPQPVTDPVTDPDTRPVTAPGTSTPGR